MEREGFSITNINIVAGMPCCDVKLVMEGNVVWQKQQVTFSEIKEMMTQTKQNCDNVVKHLNTIHKK